MKSFPLRTCFVASQRRRRGVAMVYVSMLLGLVLIPMMALSVDLSRVYVLKAQQQKAADAAALAGAYQWANVTGSLADTRARDYASMPANGAYTDGIRNTTVTTTYQPFDQFNVRQKSWFQVNISRVEPMFFAGILGTRFRNVTIGAMSAAYFRTATRLMVPITGGKYGVNSGPINIGMYGPKNITARGDKFSPMYRQTGSVIGLNPYYRSEGYNFFVELPSDPSFGKTANLQIYDPDCYDSGTDATAADKRWDEYNFATYGPKSGGGYTQSNVKDPVTTRFTAYSDNGTPYNYTDDTVIASKDYGDDATTDKKWVNSFALDVTAIKKKRTDKNVNVRLQVQTINGASENGFNLRVARPTDTEATFTGAGNGTNISAIGTLPVNFGKAGTGNVALGEVPPNATDVVINHFDSDVGVTSGDTIKYTDGTKNYTGRPLLGGAADDQEEIDRFTLAANYAGGDWMASYTAGSSDNTTWDLSYNGPNAGDKLEIKLVR